MFCRNIQNNSTRSLTHCATLTKNQQKQKFFNWCMGRDSTHKIVLCLFVAYTWYQLRSRRPANQQFVERFEEIQNGITILRAVNRYFNLFPRPTQEWMKRWLKPILNVTIIIIYYYLSDRYPSDLLTVIYALLAYNRIIEKLFEFW